MYKKQERMLLLLVAVVAGIMGLALLGRLISG